MIKYQCITIRSQIVASCLVKPIINTTTKAGPSTTHRLITINIPSTILCFKRKKLAPKMKFKAINTPFKYHIIHNSLLELGGFVLTLLPEVFSVRWASQPGRVWLELRLALLPREGWLTRVLLSGDPEVGQVGQSVGSISLLHKKSKFPSCPV